MNSFSPAEGLSLPTTSRFRWALRGHSADPGRLLEERRLRLLGPWLPSDQETLLAKLPGPESMSGMDAATERLARAVDSGEPIWVFADYDVDGISAAAMLHRALEQLGASVRVYIPDRFAEGYGLGVLGLEKIAASGGRLVVTVDNGISAVEACTRAVSLGIDVLVTDHHDVPEVLPPAFALLNPKLSSCTFPYKMLSGVGVAFYLLSGLRAKLRAAGHPRAGRLNLRHYLDFVALGTIADMAPLDGVNHILCRVGLEVMRENVESGQRPGMAELLALAGWKGDRAIGAEEIGYQMGPRLNAVGRLGCALAAEELLATGSVERARECAQLLDAENRARQDIERATTKAAMEKVAAMEKLPHAIVVGDPSWHTGVVGLVASRLVEKYYRPTLVFGESGGNFRFSGRSTHAVDLFGVLNAVRGELLAFGGHFHAVGLTLAPDRLDWLREFVETRVGELADSSSLLRPLDIDAEVRLDHLTRAFLGQWEALEPFGVGNPRPRWLVRRLRVVAVKRIGKDPSQNHARALLSDGSRNEWVTAFGMALLLEPLHRGQGEVDVVLEGRLKTWNGEQRADLRLVDIS